MLESYYDSYLMKKYLEEKKTRKEQISISGLGKCIRYLLMLGKGYEDVVPDKYQLRTFQHGKILENDMTQALISEGGLVATQVDVEFDGIPGHLDYIVKNPVMGGNFLCDMKTAKESSFQYLDQKNLEISEDYKYQVAGYFFSDVAGGKGKLRDVYKLNPMGLVCYLSKDNSLFYEPVFDCEKFKETLTNRICEIKSWQKEKELPPEITKWESTFRGKTTVSTTPRFPCYTIQKDSHRKEVGVKIWCSKIKNCPKIYEQCLNDMKRFEK